MSTSKSAHDTDPFLALIDARIGALQELRTSYLAARATGALGRPEDVAAAVIGAPVATAPAPAMPIQPAPAAPAPMTRPAVATAAAPVPVTMIPPVQRRRNQGIANAVRAHLPTMTGPQRAVEIARVLRERGLSVPKLEQAVTSILHRLKQRGEVERVSDGWVRLTAGMPVANRMSPRLRPAPRPSGEPTPDRREGGLAWRIESLLKSQGQPVAARYVADATGEPLNVVGLTLGRMVRQQRVEKQGDGRFAAVMAPSEPPPANGHTDDDPQNGHNAPDGQA